MVLAAASTLDPRGANPSAALQPREQRSDKPCRPNPGQVWGCTWYASLRYGINTRPGKQIYLPGRPQGSGGLSNPALHAPTGCISSIHVTS